MNGANMEIGDRYYAVLPSRKFVQTVTIKDITANTVLLAVDEVDLSKFGFMVDAPEVRYVKTDVRFIEPAPDAPPTPEPIEPIVFPE